MSPRESSNDLPDILHEMLNARVRGVIRFAIVHEAHPDEKAMNQLDQQLSMSNLRLIYSNLEPWINIPLDAFLQNLAGEIAYRLSIPDPKGLNPSAFLSEFLPCAFDALGGDPRRLVLMLDHFELAGTSSRPDTVGHALLPFLHQIRDQVPEIGLVVATHTSSIALPEINDFLKGSISIPCLFKPVMPALPYCPRTQIGPFSLSEKQQFVPAQSISSKQENYMAGIPPDIYGRLREALSGCEPFESNRRLRDVFAHDLLKPWRPSLPQTSAIAGRVDAVISYLHDKHRSDTGKNALVVLLQVLSEQIDPGDKRHQRLTDLAQELEHALAGGAPTAHVAHEANPAGQMMPFIAADEKLVTCARSVCRVSVPRIVGGRMEQIPTGTGWLVTPEMAFTCWHVIEARSFWDGPISQADLQQQIQNSLFTFGYTVPGQGIEYGVAAIEHHNARLDYALLRLKDRPDAPLSQRGFLTVEEHTPFTTQTQLFVVQHPQGQPQQRSAGFFVKHLQDANRILHTTPTEPGTSGAPVLNVTNWRGATCSLETVMQCRWRGMSGKVTSQHFGVGAELLQLCIQVGATRNGQLSPSRRWRDCVLLPCAMSAKPARLAQPDGSARRRRG